MGKRETKETYKTDKSQRSETDTQYNAAIGSANNNAQDVGGTVAGEKEGLTSGYTDMGNNANPLTTRNIDTSALQANLGHVSDFATTGGFTPGREASIMEGVNNLKAMGGETGGLSAENIARIRGNGGYDEFARTGGYTPESIANIKAQAISPIGSYATGTRDELARRTALTGGYAPGFDAANRQLSRDTSRAIADTSLNANVGIQDRINAGRQWGISGVSGAETGLTNQISSNRLNANQASAGIELQLQDTISRYRAMGLSMEQATAKALSDYDAQNVSNEMNVGQFNAGQRAAGLAGLQGLYNTDVGQYQNALDRSTGLLNSRTQANLGYLGNQGQLATQKGSADNWGKVLSTAGTAAGIAAIAMSSRELKEDITPLSDKEIKNKLKKLPLYTWKYKGDNTKHVGPMAEEFADAFGVGDRKTLHLADVMGVVLASQKAGMGGVK
jgi:hypothetical protein